MNRFDRVILIFIGLGIWAFVITQTIGPSPLIAHDDGHTHYKYAEEYYDHDYADSSHDHDASEISGIKSIIEACEVSDGSISC